MKTIDVLSWIAKEFVIAYVAIILVIAREISRVTFFLFSRDLLRYSATKRCLRLTFRMQEHTSALLDRRFGGAWPPRR